MLLPPPGGAHDLGTFTIKHAIVASPRRDRGLLATTARWGRNPASALGASELFHSEEQWNMHTHNMCQFSILLLAHAQSCIDAQYLYRRPLLLSSGAEKPVVCARFVVPRFMGQRTS